MDFHEIQKYAEYLFRIALKKCGDINDAEDLTQEVLLTYLNYRGEISNIKSWLYSVLSHKYNDMLRKKYKLPIVSIDVIPDETEIWDTNDDNSKDRPTETEVRREVAYLAEKYRTVIVKHYLQGEKVEKIANDLKIPKGTVLSRLYVGREQMRKGFDSMKDYDKQSYKPERLDVSCHGTPGFDDEPWSIVADDLMKQNILIVSYEKPVSITEIALALGIPTAYVESAVKDLVSNELMNKQGNKYFTDFMIITPDGLENSVDIQIEFVENNYDLLLGIVNEYIEKIKCFDFIKELPEDKLKKLIYYFVIHLFSSALYTATQKIVPSKEEYPDRPNGGKWIAVGTKYPTDFDFNNFRFGKYTYGGERWAYFDNFMNSKSICLRVYDTQPDLNKYEHGPTPIKEDDLAKMLYIISRDIPFESTGFNLMFCEDIPHLIDCGVLGERGGKPFVSIPIVSPNEYKVLDNLRIEQMYKMSDSIAEQLKEIFPQLKINIPKHLEERVAEFRKYYCYVITMAFIKSAAEKKDIDFTESTPPMVFVIDDENENIM